MEDELEEGQISGHFQDAIDESEGETGVGLEQPKRAQKRARLEDVNEEYKNEIGSGTGTLEQEQMEKIAKKAKKKASRKKQHKRLYAAIRHQWFATWWLQVYDSEEEQAIYRTPGTGKGRVLFHNKLLALVGQVYERLQSTQDSAANFGKPRGWIEHAIFNWHSEFMKWESSDNRKAWLQAHVLLAMEDYDHLLETWKNAALKWEGWMKQKVQESSTRVGDVEVDRRLDEAVFEMRKFTVLSSLEEISPLTPNCILGVGTTSVVYQAKFVEDELMADLGSSPMYAAKCFQLKVGESSSAELRACIGECFAFPYQHPGIIRPVAALFSVHEPTLVTPMWNGGTLDSMLHRMYSDHPNHQVGDVDPLWAHRLKCFKKKRLELGLALLDIVRFIHAKEWIHCNLCAENILLHFPSWHRNRKGKRTKTCSDSSDLVFIGIANCRLTQLQVEALAPDAYKHPFGTPYGPHVAPELVDPSKSRCFTVWSDVFAVGQHLRNMCWNYYDDLTVDEKDKLGAEFATKRRALRDLITRMTTHTDGIQRLTAKANMVDWALHLEPDSQPDCCFRPFLGTHLRRLGIVSVSQISRKVNSEFVLHF